MYAELDWKMKNQPKRLEVDPDFCFKPVKKVVWVISNQRYDRVRQGIKENPGSAAEYGSAEMVPDLPLDQTGALVKEFERLGLEVKVSKDVTPNEVKKLVLGLKSQFEQRNRLSNEKVFLWVYY